MWFLGLSTTKGKSFLIIGAMLLVILFTLILRKLVIYLNKEDDNVKKGRSEKPSQDTKNKSIATHPVSAMCCNAVIRTYALEELRAATRNFKFRIGIGATSYVYLAELGYGRFGAVKRLMGERGGNKKMFLDEVSVMLRISHPNLVGLLGFCCEGGEQLLLLEYIPNKSLFDRMHTDKGQCLGTLTWASRVSIALDIARALSYLHNQADPPIIHRDVKSSNILLIDENHAKLADFGLCKLGIESYYSQTPCIIKGSFGYVDVNYLKTGLVSPKSDVYSYGVLLLELITGLKSMQGSATLPEWTEETRTKTNNDEELMELLDPKLNGNANFHQLKVLVDVANSALMDYLEGRPDMSEIVDEITDCMEPQVRVNVHVHITMLSETLAQIFERADDVISDEPVVFIAARGGRPGKTPAGIKIRILEPIQQPRTALTIYLLRTQPTKRTCFVTSEDDENFHAANIILLVLSCVLVRSLVWTVR